MPWNGHRHRMRDTKRPFLSLVLSRRVELGEPVLLAPSIRNGGHLATTWPQGLAAGLSGPLGLQQMHSKEPRGRCQPRGQAQAGSPWRETHGPGWHSPEPLRVTPEALGSSDEISKVTQKTTQWGGVTHCSSALSFYSSRFKTLIYWSHEAAGISF